MAASSRATRSPSIRRADTDWCRLSTGSIVRTLEFGRSGEARIGDPVVVAAGGGTKAVHASIVGKQEFAGYWEYFLDEAIFTAPAHPFWGGASAIGGDGRLIGVGSLHVEQLTVPGGPRDINMIVPIDLLPPILGDLLTYGRVNKPARPWLGIYSAESDGEVVVAAVADRGPASAAGLRRGDILASVRGAEIADLGDFYRKVWTCGDAGVEVPIEVIRDGRALGLTIKLGTGPNFEAPSAAIGSRSRRRRKVPAHGRVSAAISLTSLRTMASPNF